MSDQLKLHLSQLRKAATTTCLGKIRHGLEKESLRVDSTGHIARTPHPEALGSTLTHPHITTDFSEALVEFITPVFSTPADSLNFLHELHSYFYGVLNPEEILWTSSMPCVLGADDSIPLANYGSSNIGRLKTLYRMGLGYRYGRSMQTIAGIHYNFSLPENFWVLYHEQLQSSLPLQDFKTEQYFHLIRNFRRYSWLLLYLFGASPALCRSFLHKQNDHGLEEYDESTFYAPFATSLRMGDLGYTSAAQAGLYISYNSLHEYTHGLTQAIKTPYPPYQKFAPEHGQHKQINASILQIENEFYGTIRPKRVTPSGQHPAEVLARDGVEYIEVRCLDLNPFLPVGIDSGQIHFLNSFLLFCLLRRSPPSDRREYHEIDQNLKAVVRNGRHPDLLLMQNDKPIALREWAAEILAESLETAALLDSSCNTSVHGEATHAQQQKVDDDTLTPSAQVLARMKELKTPYFQFAMNQSLANSDYFRARPLDAAKLAEFRAVSARSDAARLAIEASDEEDFDSYLQHSNQRE
ncbi:MAG: glutamate--cysteine ligase [Pseudomonadales bacterium]|nr:glutamate--cysteine ligase [Pseudomonadales bacterium]